MVTVLLYLLAWLVFTPSVRANEDDAAACVSRALADALIEISAPAGPAQIEIQGRRYTLGEVLSESGNGLWTMHKAKRVPISGEVGEPPEIVVRLLSVELAADPEAQAQFRKDYL